MRPLRDVIFAEAALAGFVDRRRRDLAILELLQESLPPALGAQIAIADALRPELVLSTTSGAAAALLRQRAPALLEALTREGWKFTGIRVRVQARGSSAEISKVYAKQMDEVTAATLRLRAERIEDPGLAEALRRLARLGRASLKE
jgi:hypothetical protein